MSRSTFFFLVEVFKIEIFQSRLCRVEIFVEIVKTCRDCQDLLRRVKIFEICRDAVEICREISTLSRPFESENDEKSRRIEKSRRENTKIHALSIKIETNCRETQKFSDLDKFLDLDRDFLVWTLM